MLGKGQLWMEKAVSLLPSLYPGSAAGVAGVHDEELAHLILAASDFIVMPSRYEPCGLVAMCGQRYGAVPIVSPVGGLVDIVGGGSREEGGTEEAGYLMSERPGMPQDSLSNRISAADLARTMMIAACEYRMMSEGFVGRRRRCVERDSSWERAAREWEEALLAIALSSK
jgi:granule-bound starch synthase